MAGANLWLLTLIFAASCGAADGVATEVGPGEWELAGVLLVDVGNAHCAGLARRTREAGLDPVAFEEAMDHRVHRTAVMQDVAEARGLGERAVPVLFANGACIEGAEAIRKALRTPPPKPPPTWAELAVERLALDLRGSPARGPEDAPVVIVEFTDFRCGFCQVQSRALTEVEAAFPGRVRRVFKNQPLRGDAEALLSHLAALAALDEGRSWDGCARLGVHAGTPTAHRLGEPARSMGMDRERLLESMRQHRHRGRIRADLAEVQERGNWASTWNGSSATSANPASRPPWHGMSWRPAPSGRRRRPRSSSTGCDSTGSRRWPSTWRRMPGPRPKGSRDASSPEARRPGRPAAVFPAGKPGRMRFS